MSDEEVIKYSTSKYLDFFNALIGFKDVIEIRIINMKEPKYSMTRFAHDIVELNEIIAKYDDNINLNIYFGVNSRPKALYKLSKYTNKMMPKGWNKHEIGLSRVFYFDIESTDKEKPALVGINHDKKYDVKLKEVIDFIINYLHNKYGIKPAACVRSGRGRHLYYKTKPYKYNENELVFTSWFKHTVEKIRKELDDRHPDKYHDIKFDDSVFDLTRIAGCVHTRHDKYPERPYRLIEYMAEPADVVFDMTKILDDFKDGDEYASSKKVYYSSNDISLIEENLIKTGFMYTEESIFSSFEFQLLNNYQDLPNGKLDVIFISAIRSLMKMNKLLNIEEMEQRLSAIGYNKSMDYSNRCYSEHVFLPQAINKWFIDEYKYTVNKSIKIPYINILKKKLKSNIRVRQSLLPPTIIADLPDKIINVERLFVFAKSFNRQTVKKDRGVITFFTNELLFYIKERIVDEDIWKFIEFNGLEQQVLFATDKVDNIFL